MPEVLDSSGYDARATSGADNVVESVVGEVLDDSGCNRGERPFARANIIGGRGHETKFIAPVRD